MSSIRRRRKKMKEINTVFYLGRYLNGMVDVGIYEEDLRLFNRLDRKAYRLRKRIIHWKG